MGFNISHKLKGTMSQLPCTGGMRYCRVQAGAGVRGCNIPRRYCDQEVLLWECGRLPDGFDEDRVGI